MKACKIITPQERNRKKQNKNTQAIVLTSIEKVILHLLLDTLKNISHRNPIQKGVVVVVDLKESPSRNAPGVVLIADIPEGLW